MEPQQSLLLERLRLGHSKRNHVWTQAAAICAILATLAPTRAVLAQNDVVATPGFSIANANSIGSAASLDQVAAASPVSPRSWTSCANERLFDACYADLAGGREGEERLDHRARATSRDR